MKLPLSVVNDTQNGHAVHRLVDADGNALFTVRSEWREGHDPNERPERLQYFADCANALQAIRDLTAPTDYGVLFSVETCEKIKVLLGQRNA